MYMVYVKSFFHCSFFSEMFACVTPDVEDECPAVVEQVRNISALAQKRMKPYFPSYETLRVLAKERCPKLPNGTLVNFLKHKHIFKKIIIFKTFVFIIYFVFAILLNDTHFKSLLRDALKLNGYRKS